MNKIIFLYHFYINKQRRGHYNWNLLFPFVGVILGCMTVALTLAIMEGMEHAIFNKLRNVSFPAKLIKIPSGQNHDLEKYLIQHKIDYLHGIEDQVLIMNDGLFRLTTIHGIDEFKTFRNKVFGNTLQEIDFDSQIPIIYIGKPLAIKLNISIGDTVDIAACKQINIFTGFPPKRTMIIGGIYELGILDYDQSHIFIHYTSLKDFLPKNRLLYYLHNIPNDYLLNALTHNFPGLYLKTWEDDYHSFISAMKLEKVAYSIFGFFIVGIAGFTLMSMMCLSVIEKVPQIGILRAIGAKKRNICAIFMFQALTTWFISSITGIILSLIIIELDKYYHFIQLLFPEAVFFDFPLILRSGYILLIMVISLILLLASSIYPSIKASQLEIVKSIGFRK